MKLLAFILVVIISLLGGVGIGHEFWYKESPDYTNCYTPDEAVKELMRMQATHQIYVDKPHYCNESTGTPERNKCLVESYGKLIKLVEEME